MLTLYKKLMSAIPSLSNFNSFLARIFNLSSNKFEYDSIFSNNQFFPEVKIIDFISTAKPIFFRLCSL